jgi:L,D-peptidoglycan transpeptidase YkuD (ErfK/YbiS/YcfS/YnhG family)
MTLIRLRLRNTAATRGVLTIGNLVLPCVIGRAGRKALKREGDGATPKGRWQLRRVLVRRDHVPFLATRLPCRAISRHDGWCDAPADRNYNRPVPLPYPASHERLWRDDHLYDVVVVLSHNERPRRRFAGSAVFLHIADQNGKPTAGCVALSLADMRKLLAHCKPGIAIDL